jgi:hypothetical protein
MEVCTINPNKRITLAQSITLFSLLNMISKVPSELIPEKLLNKTKSIAAKYGFKKLTNFYTFEEYGLLTLQDSEIIAKTLRDSNITLKGISREFVLRTFGTALADKVYPQYKYENNKGTSDKSNSATLKLVIKLGDIISDKGYCLESEIRGVGQAEIQWKKSITEILDSYSLKRVRLDKTLKEKYGIECNGYPFIIIPI